jgi:hypothetical protein
MRSSAYTLNVSSRGQRSKHPQNRRYRRNQENAVDINQLLTGGSAASWQKMPVLVEVMIKQRAVDRLAPGQRLTCVVPKQALGGIPT